MVFKFFRRYNKYILAGGGALLMIVFLIGPAMDSLAPSPTKQLIGTIDGKVKVKSSTLYAASAELEMLSEIFRGLVPYTDLQWLLMKYDAQRLGLSTSQQEVQRLLEELKIDSSLLRLIASRRRTTTQYILRGLQDFLIIQRYRQLMYGLDYSGNLRTSRPMLERRVHDWYSTVRIAAVAVPCTIYLDEIGTPDESALKDHFETYKDNLHGEGPIYGFGYRYPDRVKIEYLEIPGDMLQKWIESGQVKDLRVRDDKALAYYQSNQKEFLAEPLPDTEPDVDLDGNKMETPPKVQPYVQVRQKILTKLREEAARELGKRMVKAAQGKLLRHNQMLVRKDGYYVLDESEEQGWLPMSLDGLAKELQAEFGLPAKVHRHESLLDRDGLTELAGIGLGRLMEEDTISFVDYVLASRELEPGEDDPLLTYRLQKDVMSKPLVSTQGSYYLFRLTDVQKEHSPVSLEDVRDRVVFDVKRVGAYQRLISEQETWRDRARREKLSDLAAQLDLPLLEPPPFPRRSLSFFGPDRVPDVFGIGNDETFSNRIFEMVGELLGAGGLENASVEQRIDVVGLDRQQKLMLVRIDEFIPITRKHYEITAKSPVMMYGISQALHGPQAADPLSLDVLKSRVGFVESEDDQPEQAQVDESTPVG